MINKVLFKYDAQFSRQFITPISRLSGFDNKTITGC
jgi:hypothetical protein